LWEGSPQPRALPWAIFYDPVGVGANRVATRSSATGQGIRDALELPIPAWLPLRVGNACGNFADL
jgi:hypothetical protein